MSKYKLYLEGKFDKLFKPAKETDVPENWTKNADGTYDVNSNIDFADMELTKIPHKFNKVTGDFLCDDNKLTSLEGCPKEVGGNFLCYYNNLTSLEDGPKEVGGDFWCSDNKKKFTKDEVKAICKVKGDVYV